MNVGELKKMLEKYPDDMEILNSRYSDYDVVEESDWSVIKAVPQTWGVMQSHHSMSDENKAKEKKYLHLRGN